MIANGQMQRNLPHDLERNSQRNPISSPTGARRIRITELAQPLTKRLVERGWLRSLGLRSVMQYSIGQRWFWQGFLTAVYLPARRCGWLRSLGLRSVMQYSIGQRWFWQGFLTAVYLPARRCGWLMFGAVLVSSLLMATSNGQQEDAGSTQVLLVEPMRHTSAVAAQADLTLLEGMRTRRQFDLATKYCQQRLQEPRLSAANRASMTIEIIKTKTTQAIFAPQDSRQRFWNEIPEVVEQFAASQPVGTGDPPRTFLVRIQQALSHVAHAKLLRQELVAELAAPATRNDALEELAAARSILDKLQRAIEKTIPKRNGRNLAEGELTSEELLELANNVRFQLASCNLERAQLYTNDREGQIGRLDALNQVQEQLTEVARAISDGQILWWNVRLARVHCLRLMGNWEQANQVLIELAEREIPKTMAAELLEQKLKLAIASNDRQNLQQLFSLIEDSPDVKSATLELALLETVLRLSQTARVKPEKQNWMALASRKTKQIESQFGSYWGRRAELMLVNSLGTSGGTAQQGDATSPDPSSPTTLDAGTELDMLQRVASTAVRKKRFADAVKAFDRAVVLATNQGDAKRVLRLQVQAGQALEQLGNHRDAAQRMLTSAEQFSADPISATVHLRGCWNLAQLIKAQPLGSQASKEANAEFVNKLQRHVSMWPQAKTQGQAALWLGQQQQALKQHRQAFETLIAVNVNHELFFSAIEQAGQAADQVLASADSSQVDQTLESIQQRLVAIGNRLNPDSDAARQLWLNSCYLDLRYGQPEERWSGKDRSRLQGLRDDDRVGSLAEAIWITTLVFDPEVSQQDSAVEAIRQIKELDQLQQLDRLLGSLVGRVSAETIKRLGRLQLAVCDRADKVLMMLPEAQVAAATRTFWLFRKAKTMIDLGRHAEAIADLEKLERKFPRKADIKLMLARAMTIAYGTSAPQRPLSKWRAIAARLRPGSENWYEAKLNVTRMLAATGDQAAALKLLSFINVTHPWQDSQFGPDLDALLTKLK